MERQTDAVNEAIAKLPDHHLCLDVHQCWWCLNVKPLVVALTDAERKLADERLRSKGQHDALGVCLKRAELADGKLADAEKRAKDADGLQAIKPEAHRHLSVRASYELLTKIFRDVGDAHMILSRDGDYAETSRNPSSLPARVRKIVESNVALTRKLATTRGCLERLVSDGKIAVLDADDKNVFLAGRDHGTRIAAKRAADTLVAIGAPALDRDAVCPNELPCAVHVMAKRHTLEGTEIDAPAGEEAKPVVNDIAALAPFNYSSLPAAFRTKTPEPPPEPANAQGGGVMGAKAPVVDMTNAITIAIRLEDGGAVADFDERLYIESLRAARDYILAAESQIDERDAQIARWRAVADVGCTVDLKRFPADYPRLFAWWKEQAEPTENEIDTAELGLTEASDGE